MRANTARWRVVRGKAPVLALVATAACSAAAPTRYTTLLQDWRSSQPEVRVPDSAPLFGGAPFLERRELIRLVLERNPTLRAARFAWRAAVERYPQVIALEDPMLGAGVAPRSIGSSSVDDAPKLDLSQRLPFPGKLRLRGEVALAEAEAAARDFEAARLRLATMASLLFDEYALVARSLEINREHIELLGEFQRIATVRYEAGEAAQQDPIQAEVELTHALHREIVLQTAQRVTGDQINALLHRVPGEILPPPPTRAPVPSPPDDAVERLVERALEDRPELAASAARVAAEQSRVDLASREYYPDFVLTGSDNRLWQADDLQPFVGIQVNVPLQRGRRRAAVDEARARLEQARSERLALVDDVRRGVASAADRLVEAEHVSQLYRDRLLPAARDQVDAARSGFETGRNSFLTLIDAERNLLSVELGYEEALADRGRRRAELDRSLGRVPGLTW